MDYAKIYKKGSINGKKFLSLSKWVVKNHISSLPGKPLSTKDLANLAEVMAMDMATGSQLTKNRYIMTGIGIGALGLYSYYKISYEFKFGKFSKK